MRTIAKTSQQASRLIDAARNIRCYSLSNDFTGQPLTERPTIWGEPLPGERHRPLVEVSQKGFLRHELNLFKTTKLRDNGNGKYTIDVHSNLWLEFEVMP